MTSEEKTDEPGCPSCDEQVAEHFGDHNCTPLCGCPCHAEDKD